VRKVSNNGGDEAYNSHAATMLLLNKDRWQRQKVLILDQINLNESITRSCKE